MHPLQLLREEHRVIEQAIGALSAYARQVGEGKDAGGVAPAGKAVERVTADQQAQRPGGEVLVQRAQRVDGIGWPCALQFTRVGDQVIASSERRLQHRQAHRRGCLRLVAVHRLGQWDQADVLQAEGLQRIEGDAQVSVMDRIEGAAKDAYGGRGLRAEG